MVDVLLYSYNKYTIPFSTFSKVLIIAKDATYCLEITKLVANLCLFSHGVFVFVYKCGQAPMGVSKKLIIQLACPRETYVCEVEFFWEVLCFEEGTFDCFNVGR